MKSLFVTDESVERRSTPGYFWIGFWTTLGSIVAGALVLLLCWSTLIFMGYEFLRHLGGLK